MSTNKTSITVTEAIIKFANKHLGEIVSSKDIVDELVWDYNFRPESILPSDFVYNPDKERKSKMRSTLLFCKAGRGKYYCVGHKPSFLDKLRFLRKH